MTSTDRLRRSIRAVRGFAYGDALGEPASLHRTIRDPWVRGMQHRGAEQLDEARVVRTVTPFVLTAIGARTLVATDDTENFAAVATALLDAPAEDAAHVFPAWRAVTDAPDAWVGPAQRSALRNAELGLTPPQTGNDNPAFYDDTALPGALACAILARDAAHARELAGDIATITHARIGVQAAALFAGVMAELLDGADVASTVRAAASELPEGDWLGDGIRDALAIIDDAPFPFAAVPALIERFAARTYSHPGTVAETLPLAFAIAAATDGRAETALPLSLSITRHQDSLPALVGALCGAGYAGTANCIADLDELAGVTLPALAGVRLDDLVERLHAKRG